MIGTGSLERIAPLAMAKDDSPWGTGGGAAGGTAGDTPEAGAPATGAAPAPAPSPAPSPAPAPGPANPWLTPEIEPAPRRSASIEDIFRGRGGGGSDGRDSGGPGASLLGNMRWLPLITAALIGGWLVSTTVHMLAQDERGLKTTLGRYTETVGPGLQLTLPWPLQALTISPTGREVTTALPEKDAETLMNTRDGELIDLAFQVRWRISDLKQYTYDLPEGEAAIRRLADAEMRVSVAELPFDAVWSGKQQAELQTRVLGRVQRVLDAWHAGVTVAGVEVLRAAPPGRLSDTFKKIGSAREGARKNREDAARYRDKHIQEATTEAADFDRIYAEYVLAPQVTRQKMYYEMMDRVLSNNQVAIGGSGVAAPPPPAPQPATDAGAPPAASGTAAAPKAGQ